MRKGTSHKFGEETGPLHNLVKRTLHKFGGESRGIRISSRNNEKIEQTETTEDSTDISGLVLYQTLFYLLEKITTSFGYNTKIQNPSRYFNVSGNIIK